MALQISQHVDDAAPSIAGWRCGQGFTPASDFSVSSVKLKFAVYPTFTGGVSDLQVKLEVWNGSGWDSHSDTIQLTGAGLVGDHAVPNSPSYIENEFVFPTPIPVANSVLHRIRVVYMHDTGTVPTGYCWCASTATNPYAGGVAYDNNLNTQAAYDLWFEVHGDVKPNKPTSPTPSHTDTGIALNTSELSWTAGANTDTFDVYFGESGSEVLVAEGQDVSDENWAILFGSLGYGTTYGWRVDASNFYGTTTGDTWTFTTLTFDPPVPSGQNGMLVVKRLVAAANNKFWYEDI